METYSFTLHVEGIDIRNDRYEDALIDAGCDDALIAIEDGKLILDFDREATDLQSALRSAMDCVEKAGGHVINITALGPLPPLPE